MRTIRKGKISAQTAWERRQTNWVVMEGGGGGDGSTASVAEARVAPADASTKKEGGADFSLTREQVRRGVVGMMIGDSLAFPLHW